MSLVLNPTQMQILNNAQHLPMVARWSMAFAVTVTKWDTNYRTRKHLRNMPAHMLNDIGLDTATARAEASKPFWQA
ncbi:MAG: DUF1127 domain-containing protein [Octadecabacter sp.]